MGKRAIFAHCGLKFWLDTARLLRDEHDWEILYFLGSDSAGKEIFEAFPEAIFHPNSLAIKNEFPQSCTHIRQAALDKDLLTAMSYYETVSLKMMDRFDYDGLLTYRKRIFGYHRQVMYWKGVLDHFRPDVVAFRIAPHFWHDYVIYALCRVMGIKTVMFERTSIPGLVYPVESFEQGSYVLRNRYKEKIALDPDRISLSASSLSHLGRLGKSYKDAMPFHMKYKLENYKRGGALQSPAGAAFSVLKGLAGDISRFTGSDVLRKNFFSNIGVFTKMRLQNYYHGLTEEVDFERPYIFVALQCEPERQTCPSGGVFGNQYLMIDALSKAAPAGWMVYVKEHGSQFKSFQLAERSRSIEFYDYIDSMPNVCLVPLAVTSFDLIDHAKVAATVSGTVGWESVVRGKPAFLFGHGWYKDAPGVFVTHTARELEQAMKAVHAGCDVDPGQIKIYVAAVEEVGVRAYIDRVYEKLGLVSHEESVGNLSRCINDFVGNTTGSNEAMISHGQTEIGS